jgi:hypothetical protein
MSRDPHRIRHPDTPKTRQDIEDELTEANFRKPFEEYPKHIYHPDGTLSAGTSMSVETQTPEGYSRTNVIRTRLVRNSSEQSACGGEWLERPQEAVDEQVKRDSRVSQEFVAKANAEAAAKQQAAFDKAVADEVARQLSEKKPK